MKYYSIFEEGMVTKTFEIDGQNYWNNANQRSKGVLRVFPSEMSLEAKIYSGADPNASDLLAFILADKDVRMLIHAYQERKRKERYAINVSTGMSGREDWYIDYYDEHGLQTGYKHLMHVSCFGKCGYIKKLYIGDFVEMLYSYGIPEKRSSAKYVKPYFEPEGGASTEVHKIL